MEAALRLNPIDELNKKFQNLQYQTELLTHERTVDWELACREDMGDYFIGKCTAKNISKHTKK